jgi:hypothetical protein
VEGRPEVNAKAVPFAASGADEVIIPEDEGSLMTARMIQKFYPIPLAIK